jgi:hypothetical protein
MLDKWLTLKIGDVDVDVDVVGWLFPCFTSALLLALLLLYCCFTVDVDVDVDVVGWLFPCFTSALLVLYCCITAALLLLYCCSAGLLLCVTSASDIADA